MEYYDQQKFLNKLTGINSKTELTNKKLDTLIGAFNTQAEALNRQAAATEALVVLMTKIENNTNPDPKINAPSKRVDMNK